MRPTGQTLPQAIKTDSSAWCGCSGLSKFAGVGKSRGAMGLKGWDTQAPCAGRELVRQRRKGSWDSIWVFSLGWAHGYRMEHLCKEHLSASQALAPDPTLKLLYNLWWSFLKTGAQACCAHECMWAWQGPRSVAGWPLTPIDQGGLGGWLTRPACVPRSALPGLTIVGEPEELGPQTLGPRGGLATAMTPVRSLLAQGACGTPTPSPPGRHLEEGRCRCAHWGSALAAADALHTLTSVQEGMPGPCLSVPSLCLSLYGRGLYLCKPVCDMCVRSLSVCVSAWGCGQTVCCVSLCLLTRWPSRGHTRMFACVSGVSMPENTCECAS